MTTRKNNKKERKWKKLFYSLLGFNVLAIILLLFLLFGPVDDRPIIYDTNQMEEDYSEFVIRTTKQNLNELINAYISKMLEGSKHYYSISLEDDVHLMGELPAFSTTVPLSVHLEPFVQENGDIILKQRSISIGLLELPNQKIMEYMDKYLDFPSWVTINPKKEEIYLAVTEMEMNSNFTIAVEHIDLEANHLAFRIHIPYNKIGQYMLHFQ